APGEIDVLGHTWHDKLGRAVLETAAREARWGTPLPEGQGRGIGYCVRHVGLGSASLELAVTADACVEVRTNMPEVGGGQLTTLQRVIASELGIAPERV